MTIQVRVKCPNPGSWCAFPVPDIITGRSTSDPLYSGYQPGRVWSDMKKTCYLALMAVLLCPLLSACTNSVEPPENVSQAYWTPLFLVGSGFVDLVLEDGALFVAERTRGVYVQRPAFTGGWQHVGLSVDDLDDPLRHYGLTSLAVDGDLMVAGLNLPPGDPRPELLQRRLGDSEWVPSQIQPNSLVRDLVKTAPGKIIGLDDLATFSSDDGAIWTSSTNQLQGLELGHLFLGRDGLYCGGHGPQREPKLFRSEDGGSSWKQVNLSKTLGVAVGTIHAMAEASGPDLARYLTVDADVYRSLDGGKTFEYLIELPRTPGHIHVNPENPDEMIITGGPIFWTQTGGEFWDVFYLPRGLPSRDSAVDWEQRKMVVTVHDNIREAVYLFDLAVAEPLLRAGR